MPEVIDRCAECGQPTPINELDAKPEGERWRALIAQHGQVEALSVAADEGLDFTRLECRSCYGPGYGAAA